MNYMDYTYDACLYMFSAGQVTRMEATLAPGGPRAWLAGARTAAFADPLAAIQSTPAIRQCEFTMFPNPTSNELTLNIPFVDATPTEVSILDLTGKVLFNQRYDLSYEQNQITLNVGTFRSGLYLVRIRNGNFVSTKPMTVVH